MEFPPAYGYIAFFLLWKHRFLPDNPRPASGHQIDTIILYGIILTVVQASCEEAARPDAL
jgi:hypothetical protein